MAKLPQQNKILPENFPEQKFMPQLLSPINSFISQVILALNKNLTFTENMAGQILAVTIDGTFPLNLQWTLPQKPVAIWIGNCRETSGTHSTVTTALYVDWEMNPKGQLQINNIAGLSASSANRFHVTLLAITG